MRLASIERAAIEDFFRSYIGAFERYDPDALAAHFAYPALIASDDEAVRLNALGSADSYKAMIAALLQLYRRLGVAGGRITQMDVVTLSPHLAEVRLDWEICGAAMQLLYAHRASYTLLLRADGLRICVVCANEMPALRECLKARGA